MRRMTIAALVLGVVVACAASAYGGGGGFSGASLPIPRFSNNNDVFLFNGGYGYGVTSGGHRIGGFGVGVTAEDGRSAGGFGGVINGRQARLGSLTASLNTWLGVGGLRLSTGDPRQFFAYYAEVNGELGLAVLPFLQISGYLGMQAMGNLIPGDPVVDNSVYHPVSGIRVTWGWF